MDRKDSKKGLKTGLSKGMILCAGLGTRLLPITERYPKPLVPILNIPNLLHVFHLLERAGIKEVILNLYHLPERIEEFIADQKRDLSISFSKETVLLGTGGGVKKAEPFFNKEPFVLANCDFVTNAPIEEVVARHFKRKAIATMVLLDDKERQKRYSKVGVDKDDHLCVLPRLETKAPARSGIFTGLHVLSPEIFQFLEEKPCGINEILYPALMKEQPDRVFGDFPSNFYWFDTGEISTIHEATLALLDLLRSSKSGLMDVIRASDTAYYETKPGVWIAEDAELPRDVEIVGPVFIGKGCIVGKKSKLGPYAVLGDNVILEENCKLTRAIALSGSRLEMGKRVEDAIVFEGAILPATRSPNQ